MGAAMTEKEISTTVISHWRLEHSPFEIARSLTLAGIPTSQEKILHIIRRFVDACSENPTYKPSRGR
jgi:hypothetical protein